jgi:hypothetical protein
MGGQINAVFESLGPILGRVQGAFILQNTHNYVF